MKSNSSNTIFKLNMLFTFFFFLVGLSSVEAQTTGKNFIDLNYIEVTGKAEMEVVPDEIYIRIVISEKDFNMKQKLEDIEKKMIDKLKEIGVPVEKEFSVMDFSSSFKYYILKKTEIYASKEYQLILHDAKTINRVYQEMDKLGISNISITKLDHTKMEMYRKEVKINAMKAAKEKAEALAGAINQTIGKAVYIQEIEVNNFSSFYANKALAANAVVQQEYSSMGNDKVPYIDFAKIPLEYSIMARSELK